MLIGKSIRHMESLQGLGIFALVGPSAEKDEAEINGPSVKPDTHKWEIHTLWKELPTEEVDAASLKSLWTALG